MKSFNLSVGRLVISNLVFTKADASQIIVFIETIFFFSEGTINMWHDRSSNSVAKLERPQPCAWLDR